MRLCYCYHCRTLAKIASYEGPPDYDGLLQDWIDRHMHGMSVDEHPGGRVFNFSEAGGVDRRVSARMNAFGGVQAPTAGTGDEELSAMELSVVQEVRAELQKANQEVFDMRDELRIDAVTCHHKHGQPSWPGKPCIDYQAGSKLLGRRNAPKEFRQYLCTYCPYESTVTVAKRARRGDYRPR